MVLHYTILYYTILYDTIVYTILHNTILYCNILYYTILYYTILYDTIVYTVLYNTILYYTIRYYSLLSVYFITSISYYIIYTGVWLGVSATQNSYSKSRHFEYFSNSGRGSPTGLLQEGKKEPGLEVRGDWSPGPTL